MSFAQANLTSDVTGVLPIASGGTGSTSVANNLIRYLSSLRSLALVENLERVSLEGNVVTSMPFYRQYLIGLIKSIHHR